MMPFACKSALLLLSLAASGQGLRLKQVTRHTVVKDAQKYIVDLKAGNKSTREEAAIALGRMRIPEAVPALSAAMLKDRSCSVRQSSVWALSSIGGTEAAQSLAVAMDMKHGRCDGSDELFFGSWMLEDTSSALQWMPSAAAVPALISVMQQTKDIEVRVYAINCLGERGSEEAVPALMKIMQEDEDVHWNAMEALVNLGSTEVVPTLIHTLEQNKDGYYRSWAGHALGLLRSEEAVPALIAVMQEDRHNTTRNYVRAQMAWALGEIGSVKAVPALIYTYLFWEGPTDDGWHTLDWRDESVCDALEKISGSSQVRMALVKEMKKSNDRLVRSRAEDALDVCIDEYRE